MDREIIKKNVLRVIDEITPFQNIDVIWDALLEETINEASKRLLITFPIHLLPSKKIPITTFENTEEGWGTIALPNDFLRLSAFKMNSWRRAVHQPIVQEDPRYYLQKNKYSRAGVAKPVCALASEYAANNTFQTILELYPIYYDWGTNQIEKANYIGVTLPEELPDHLLEAFFWLAGHQVLITMEKTDFAQLCFAKYQEYLTSNTPIPIYP